MDAPGAPWPLPGGVVACACSLCRCSVSSAAWWCLIKLFDLLPLSHEFHKRANQERAVRFWTLNEDLDPFSPADRVPRSDAGPMHRFMAQSCGFSSPCSLGLLCH